ncbi:hypothetical protein WMY93_002666 [Mugilogobius chulae]|uniref:C-type lectin domain-containing protein n=1 Tax=Mugilogobius chulae TaxID=88201 RepID=A0AAW0PUZ3_9GOBI
MKALLLVLHFGLSFLCVWNKRAYRLIENKLPWTEAQSYCRSHFIDLATVDDEEQLNLLIEATQRNTPLGHFWTGLYDDVDSWRWSLQEDGYYDGGLEQFRLWEEGQPKNYNNSFTCSVMLTNGKWKTGSCEASKRPFICYSELLRQYHSDMASVRNQLENDQLHSMISIFTHIGLYRDSWKWSDRSPVLFQKFNTEITSGLPCVSVTGTGMETEDCSTLYPFVCNDYPLKQVVTVKVTNNFSLNLEAVSEALLEQTPEGGSNALSNLLNRKLMKKKIQTAEVEF